MIGAKIIEMRQKMGWTQNRLAKALNVNTKSIKNWENEVSDPSLKNVVRLAKVFSVTTDYLLGLETTCSIPVSYTHLPNGIKGVYQGGVNDRLG